MQRLKKQFKHWLTTQIAHLFLTSLTEKHQLILNIKKIHQHRELFSPRSKTFLDSYRLFRESFDTIEFPDPSTLEISCGSFVPYTKLFDLNSPIYSREIITQTYIMFQLNSPAIIAHSLHIILRSENSNDCKIAPELLHIILTFAKLS